LQKLIQSQKDMAVVGEIYDSVEVLLTVADTGICSHLLIEFPHLIIFALSKDRKHVVTYRSSIPKQEIQAEFDLMTTSSGLFAT
jgi:hypothetical protein